MTFQEKKDVLGRYIILGRHLEDLKKERSDWRTRGESVTASLSGMPKVGRVSDKVGDAAAEIVKLDRKIERQMSLLAGLRIGIEKQISSVEDETLRRILYLKYIDGDTLEVIAEKMNYGYRHMIRLHKKALDEVEI